MISLFSATQRSLQMPALLFLQIFNGTKNNRKKKTNTRNDQFIDINANVVVQYSFA